MRENCSCTHRTQVFGGLKSGQIIRKGSYLRRSDGRRVKRFLCRSCGRYFSWASFDACFGQNKRQINATLLNLLCSGVSMRRSARLLGVDLKTVARKLRFLASIEKERNQKLVTHWSALHPVEEIHFDEMETSHHTKCKPLSIPLAVSKDRLILGFEVCVMPASGKLAEISRKKYGKRPDFRPKAVRDLLRSIRPHLETEPGRLTFTSDQCPRYPIPVRRLYPGAKHKCVKGRRGCVVGQGELKKIGFDPLFPLNHTAAMFRACVNRLFRRTWCTTKKIESLIDHLTLYTAYHNRQILKAMA
jgi:transposase-like protein